MTKRFTTDSPTTPVTQFKITDFWLNRELTTIKEVVDAMNDQQETIKLLQKANENISRASLEISDILENGGVILTKEQLDEIIREGSYRKKVTKTLKEKNELKSKIDDKEVAVEVETEKLMNKVFSLIDEKLGEARLAFQTKGYKSYYSGRIDALEELRKEVSE